jgi:Tol biopolymer transport system component
MLQMNNSVSVMETGYHFKNGASSKSQTSRKNYIISVEGTDKKKSVSYQSIALKSLIVVVLNSFIVSCGTVQTTPRTPTPSIYEAISVSEERGTNFDRITTDIDAVVRPGGSATTEPSKYGVLLYPYQVIALSTDNEKIAFITDRDTRTNVMQKSTMHSSASTQLTFRTNVRGFTLSQDGQRLLFTEFRNGNTGIYMMNLGSTIVQQISPSGTNDNVPTIDQNNNIFFDRREGGNFDYALWGCDLETRLFSNYTQGFSPCIDPANNKIVYFARNTNVNIFPQETTPSTSASSTSSSAASEAISSAIVGAIFGRQSTQSSSRTSSSTSTSTSQSAAPQSRNINSRRSEILRFNTENGTEELILSDRDKSFSSPQVSPDGRWILVVGINKTTDGLWNSDIYVVSSEGTNLTQLTYHPGNDLSPIWSTDGRSIYFVSQRDTKGGAYNVWRMNFSLN